MCPLLDTEGYVHMERTLVSAIGTLTRNECLHYLPMVREILTHVLLYLRVKFCEYLSIYNIGILIGIV